MSHSKCRKLNYIMEPEEEITTFGIKFRIQDINLCGCIQGSNYFSVSHFITFKVLFMPLQLLKL